MSALFIVLSLLVAFIGAISLTQATLGVGLMAVACLLAIFARIAQAAEQHKQLKTLLIGRVINK